MSFILVLSGKYLHFFKIGNPLYICSWEEVIYLEITFTRYVNEEDIFKKLLNRKVLSDGTQNYKMKLAVGREEQWVLQSVKRTQAGVEGSQTDLQQHRRYSTAFWWDRSEIAIYPSRLEIKSRQRSAETSQTSQAPRRRMEVVDVRGRFVRISKSENK